MENMLTSSEELTPIPSDNEEPADNNTTTTSPGRNDPDNSTTMTSTGINDPDNNTMMTYTGRNDPDNNTMMTYTGRNDPDNNTMMTYTRRNDTDNNTIMTSTGGHDAETEPDSLQEKQDGDSDRWIVETISVKDKMKDEQDDLVRENTPVLLDTVNTDETSLSILDAFFKVLSEPSCGSDVANSEELDVIASFSAETCNVQISTAGLLNKTNRKQTSTEIQNEFIKPCQTSQFEIIAAFAKETKKFYFPSSASVECLNDNVPEISDKYDLKSLSKRRLQDDTSDQNTGKRSKQKAGTDDEFRSSEIAEKPLDESDCDSRLLFVDQGATTTTLIIMDYEKSRDITDLLRQAIERAQDGFPESPVEVMVHIVNINNIRSRTLTSECHITIRALNPGHEMEAPPADRNLARDLQVDYPNPMGECSGPPCLKYFAMYDCQYKLVSPGDIIHLDYGLYTHFAVYIGEGFIVHAGRDGVACEKLFEVVGSALFSRYDHLDQTYSPKPTREIILRALCRIQDQRFTDSASFATWCRYGRTVNLGDCNVSGNLSFMLGLSA